MQEQIETLIKMIKPVLDSISADEREQLLRNAGAALAITNAKAQVVAEAVKDIMYSDKTDLTPAERKMMVKARKNLVSGPTGASDLVVLIDPKSSSIDAVAKAKTDTDLHAAVVEALQVAETFRLDRAIKGIRALLG